MMPSELQFIELNFIEAKQARLRALLVFLSTYHVEAGLPFPAVPLLSRADLAEPASQAQILGLWHRYATEGR